MNHSSRVVGVQPRFRHSWPWVFETRFEKDREKLAEDEGVGNERNPMVTSAHRNGLQNGGIDVSTGNNGIRRWQLLGKPIGKKWEKR
ncbi:hypothetical protein V6N13_107263 [Hibiscus sabdariffa]